MIRYERHAFARCLNLFTLTGNVFPRCLMVSLPCALWTAILAKMIYEWDWLPTLAVDDAVMSNNAIWAGFNFLVGFLVVFRTSQAYNRFWDGCTSLHKMKAQWFDCCASLMAFCKRSTGEHHLILTFQNTTVRLFSMLHAAAMADIEVRGTEDRNKAVCRSEFNAFTMELLDARGIDPESILAVHASSDKVELIFQWIQGLIVENTGNGVLSIPPPLLTRSFQQLAEGLVHFHDALMLSRVPFPFPYAVACDWLLVMHWILTPFVVSQWCTRYYFAAVFAFIQVFTLCALNMIAVELEHPFGTDPNDLDGKQIHTEMNDQLRVLLRPQTLRTPTPFLAGGETLEDLMGRLTREPNPDDPSDKDPSFLELWQKMGAPGLNDLKGVWEPCGDKLELKAKYKEAGKPFGKTSSGSKAVPLQDRLGLKLALTKVPPNRGDSKGLGSPTSCGRAMSPPSLNGGGGSGTDVGDVGGGSALLGVEANRAVSPIGRSLSPGRR